VNGQPKHAAACLLVLLTGCQTWNTIVLSVPAGKNDAVRAAFSEVSRSVGLSTCATWKVTVRDADECFGGNLGNNHITVAAMADERRYVIKLGVYSSGIYDADTFAALELRYRTMLQEYFPRADIAREESRSLLTVEQKPN